MNLSWEREAGKALRVAAALFELPYVAGLDAVRAQELLDPSAAMESLFRRLLGTGPKPGVNPGFEPEALFQARATTASATSPSALGLWHAAASRAVREPQVSADIPVGTHRPVASDDRPDRFPDSNGRKRKSALPDQEGFLMPGPRSGQDAKAEPTAAREARLDARREGEAETEPSIPLVERCASPRELGRSSPSIQAPSRQNGMRHCREELVPGTGRGTAQGTLSPAVSLPDASASQSMRLVTELSDLQTLFRSVVADSQSKDNHLSSEAPPSMPEARTDDQSAPAKPIRQPSHRDHREHEAQQKHVAGWPGLGRADAPVGVFAETHLPSVGGASPAMPDPVWEDILLDRLLDRWEERLREQALRHLGFTGGLT